MVRLILFVLFGASGPSAFSLTGEDPSRAGRGEGPLNGVNGRPQGRGI